MADTSIKHRTRESMRDTHARQYINITDKLIEKVGQSLDLPQPMTPSLALDATKAVEKLGEILGYANEAAKDVDG